MSATVRWLSYDFLVYDPNATWNDIAGIYIFCGLNAQNLWVPLYVGQTDSFRNRIPSHDKWTLALQRGATHVHAMVVPQAATRDMIEKDLIGRLQPPLNIQHR